MNKLFIIIVASFLMVSCSNSAQDTASRVQEQCSDRFGNPVLCSFTSAAHGWAAGAREFGSMF